MGLEHVHPQYGPSFRWHHTWCFDWRKASATSAIEGFGEMDAETQGEIAGLVGSAPASAAMSSPARSPAAKASGGGAIDLTGDSPPAAAAAAAAAAGPSTAQLSMGLSKENCLERGVSRIEYARVKKPSPCKDCGGGIANGEPRVGDRQPSQFYEGMQTRWLHLSCALEGACGGIQRISQLQGWDLMGYDASQEIRTETGEMLEPQAEAALKAGMEGLEALQDLLLEHMTVDALTDALTLNRINPRDLTLKSDTIKMSVIVADGMTNGLCANCPVCHTAGLVLCAGRVCCWGYLSPNVRCVYREKKETVKRYAFTVAPEIIMSEWLLDWADSQEQHAMVAAGPLPAAAAAAAPVFYLKGLPVGGVKALLMKRGAGTEGKEGELLPPKGKKAELLVQLQSLLNKSPSLPKDIKSWSEQELHWECDIRNLACSEGSKKAAIIKTLESAVLEDKAHSKKRKAAAESLSSPQKSKAKFEAKPATPQDGPSSAKKMPKPKPKRKKPMAGSPILEVHEGYEQVGPRGGVSMVVVGTEVYSASLAQVDLKAQVNRFYLLQLLKLSGGGGFQLFNHWGRIGGEHLSESFQGGEGHWGGGRANFQTYGAASLPDAIALFKKWFFKKTGSEWDERHIFMQQPSAYDFVELNTAAPTGAAAASTAPKVVTAKTTLPPATADLIDLIFDEEVAVYTMKESGIKVKELPLGSVTEERVARAHELVGNIKALLEKRPAVDLTGDNTEQEFRIWEARLHKESTEFYTTIPSNETMVIDNDVKLAELVKLLNVLGDIAKTTALRGRKAGKKKAKKVKTTTIPHPSDAKYESLACELTPLKHSDPMFALVAASLERTATPNLPNSAHPGPGSLCGFSRGLRPTVSEVFEVNREGEAERFAEHDAMGNRRLLWHGTNVATVAAICSSGMRIMPHSGGRVGAGIYLADESNKSGHYVVPGPDGSGVMLLAEACLGTPKLIVKDSSTAQRYKVAPKGTDSVQAVGRSFPDPQGTEEVEIDGKTLLFETGSPSLQLKKGSSHFYQNEFLVYKESQVRLRYVVRISLVAEL